MRFGTVSGTSAAAAVVAGAAAVLAEGRPRVASGRAPGPPRRLGAANATSMPPRPERASSTSGLGGPAGDRREPAAALVRRCDGGHALDRARRSGPQPLDPTAHRLEPRVGRPRAEGRLDHVRPAARAPPPGPERRRRRHARTRAISRTRPAPRRASSSFASAARRRRTSRGRWPSRRAEPICSLARLDPDDRRSRTGLGCDARHPQPRRRLDHRDAGSPGARARDRSTCSSPRRRRALGVLARRRELLPGRYTFGLTGRGPDGERLRRGAYVDAGRGPLGRRHQAQVESVRYDVR